MRVLNTDLSELMNIERLEREGSNLVIHGNIMTTLPIRCVLTPSEVRRAFGLLSLRKIAFLLTMPFRS